MSRERRNSYRHKSRPSTEKRRQTSCQPTTNPSQSRSPQGPKHRRRPDSRPRLFKTGTAGTGALAQTTISPEVSHLLWSGAR